jgi:hypothetical protein
MLSPKPCRTATIVDHLAEPRLGGHFRQTKGRPERAAFDFLCCNYGDTQPPIPTFASSHDLKRPENFIPTSLLQPHAQKLRFKHAFASDKNLFRQ